MANDSGLTKYQHKGPHTHARLSEYDTGPAARWRKAQDEWQSELTRIAGDTGMLAADRNRLIEVADHDRSAEEEVYKAYLLARHGG